MSVSADTLPELLARLEQALIAETDALRARDVAALGQAVCSKRRVLAEIGDIARVAAGVPGKAGVTEILRRCRALNDIAGSAIAVLRQETAHALGLLGIENASPDYGSPGRPARAARQLAVC